jgi:glycosyltransferase involved in cell wall biosynthesis
VTILVGHTRRNYGHERVIYGARHEGLAFRRVPSLPTHRLSKAPFWSHAAVIPAARGVDLVHLYNDVALASPRPWVASFEDVYPVAGKNPRARAAALEAASSARCRTVLAISEHAKRLLALDPAAGPALLPKCRVVPPCVAREDDLYERHRAFLDAEPAGKGPLRLLFVGNLFFLKGGEFVLDALEPFAARPAGVRLTIVSTMELDSYVSRADEERRRAVRERIGRAPWIEHLERQPPRAVRERMATSHLLLFPTLNDTFGFVLAEALAAGLDVATVATRAVPEILPPECLEEAVTLPVNEREEWIGTRLWRTAGEDAWRARWAEARERIVEGLRTRVGATLAAPRRLAARAPRLRAAYEARFSPERLGERLLAVYREALPRLSR